MLCWQTTLPKGAVPFFVIVYADKSHLSSFGTAKGYPAIARCAHLPITIRNGEGIGGGVKVGWFPIVGHMLSESVLNINCFITDTGRFW